MPSAVELAALTEATALAARGAATALPNPVVGCVLLSPAGDVVGRGWHERPGGPHAEVVALAGAGAAARGATAVVTLEPCDHTGRTGPCSVALLGAGVARVVVAVRDPWAPASGGVERLRAAGVDVEVLDPDDPAALAAEHVNRVWIGGVVTGRPWVTWKAGTTLDGRVAAPDGTSRWITSAASRADVHALRSAVDTMLVGVGTVLADDPWLTVRGPDGGLAPGRQPLRVVLDTDGRTPAGARVNDDAAETWVVTAGAGLGSPPDPARVLAALYASGQRHVLLEGGPRVAAAFLDAGLVDEVVLYVAPLALGAGAPALDGGAATTLADAHRFALVDVARFGDDVRLRYRPR